MIRLRIEKEVKTFSKEGLIFYKAGRPYQVILEQLSGSYDIASPVSGPVEKRDLWVPVEVIECPTE